MESTAIKQSEVPHFFLSALNIASALVIVNPCNSFDLHHHLRLQITKSLFRISIS